MPSFADTHAQQQIGIAPHGSDVSFQQLLRRIYQMLFVFRPAPSTAEGFLPAVAHIRLRRYPVFSVRPAHADCIILFRAAEAAGIVVGGGPAIHRSHPSLIPYPAQVLEMLLRSLETDCLWLILLNQPHHIRPAQLMGNDAAIEPDLEQFPVIAPDFGQLPLHHADIFLIFG